MRTADQIFFEQLLLKMIDLGGSDLHVSVGNVPMIRLNGALQSFDHGSIISPEIATSLAEAWLSPEERKHLSSFKECVMTKTFKDKFRFRIHVMLQQGYPSFSFRYLPNAAHSLKDLGLPDLLQSVITSSDGLVLICGGYGSGRSTTLWALVSEINRRFAKRIVTIEQPVELLLPDDQSMIDQREVGRDVASISDGLDQVTGEDIDVVVVSEIFNSHEMEKVFTVADSGRLVLATFNAESFSHAIEKIMSLFNAADRDRIRRLLSRVISAVVIQKLVKKKRGGRVAACEIILPTDPIRTLMAEGNHIQLRNMLIHSREQGILSMDQSLADLTAKGMVARDDAEKEAMDLESFRNRLAHSNDSLA